MVQDLVNSCLVCGNDQNDGEFEELFIEVGGEENVVELSETGQMYEDLLGLQIDLINRDCYPKYMCNSCDLQLKLFKKIKLKAFRNFEKCKKKQQERDSIAKGRGGNESEEFEVLENCKGEDSVGDCEGEGEEEYLDEYLDRRKSHLKMDRIFTEEDFGLSNEETSQLDDERLEIVVNEVLQIANIRNPETNGETVDIKDENYTSIDYLDDNLLEEDSNEQPEFIELENADQPLTVSNEKVKAKRLDLNCGFICCQCGKKLKTKDSLKAHMNTIHLGIAPYQCEMCASTFKQKAHLAYHMAKHKNIRKFTCEICDKSYLSNSDLKIHLRFHRGERPYKCKSCDKSYALLQHLKMHEYTHNENVACICEICHQKFATPVTLRTHMQSIHTSPQFHCEICGKSFRRKHHLVVHYKTHNGFSRPKPVEATRTTPLSLERLMEEAADDVAPIENGADSTENFIASDETNASNPNEYIVIASIQDIDGRSIQHKIILNGLQTNTNYQATQLNANNVQYEEGIIESTDSTGYSGAASVYEPEQNQYEEGDVTPFIMAD